MSLRTAGIVLMVIFWSVTGQDYGVTYTTHSICALKGSTVELSCTYKYPKKDKVTSTFWFTRKDSRGKFVSLRDDDDYKSRVKYNNDEPESRKTTEKRHFLTIGGVRESDSAKYMFRFITSSNKYFGNTGIRLSVSGLQVTFPSTVIEGQGVSLTCSPTCPLTDNSKLSYIWYKNGHLLTNEHNDLNLHTVIGDADNYSCAVKGREMLRSPEFTLNVRWEQTSLRKPVAGITVIVLFLIFCLSGFIWSKRKAFKTTNDTRDISDNGQSAHVYEIISDLAVAPTAAQTTDTVKQEDAYYSSVHYRSQDVPLYSTVQLPEAQKQEGQLAAAKLNHPSAPIYSIQLPLHFTLASSTSLLGFIWFTRTTPNPPLTGKNKP
ncbi:uncharacterized protein LOC105012070 isoform X2 [Esox lucius]|uniref:uncharacterized protein LOC105012070 isoform X2 n=1 Tax=Esox lucius TaxID=8010 RepID=UPI001476E3CD|nr:uncharacterized protein LOC105012070 isoform X2 [Esox lucius]